MGAFCHPGLQRVLPLVAVVLLLQITYSASVVTRFVLDVQVQVEGQKIEFIEVSGTNISFSDDMPKKVVVRHNPVTTSEDSDYTSNIYKVSNVIEYGQKKAMVECAIRDAGSRTFNEAYAVRMEAEFSPSIVNLFEVVWVVTDTSSFLITRFIRMDNYYNESTGYMPTPYFYYHANDFELQPTFSSEKDAADFYTGGNVPGWPGAWVTELTLNLPQIWPPALASLLIELSPERPVVPGSDIFVDVDETINCTDTRVSVINIICDGVSYGSVLTVDIEVFGLKCVCVATYNDCYNDTFPFNVYTTVSGPDSVSITLLESTDTPPPSCTAFHVYCDTTTGNAYPGETVTIMTNGIIREWYRVENLTNGLTRYFFEAPLSNALNENVSCIASNSGYNAQQVTDQASFNVLDPQSGCGGSYHGPYGKVTFYGYDPDVNCTWTISVTEGRRISLSLIDFTTTGITIIDPVLGLPVVDNAIPQNFLELESNTVVINFAPAGQSPDLGFSLQWMLGSSQCGRDDITEVTGRLTSPGYPTTFGDGNNCVWRFNMPTGVNLAFTFDDFKYQPGPTHDYVFFDGAHSPLLTSTLDPLPYTVNSYSNVPNITHVPNDQNFAYPGMSLSWAPGVPGPISCGGTVLASKGTIEAPGYPRERLMDAECEWVIRNPDDTQMMLVFGPWDMFCDTSLLTIRDGPSVYELCGEFPPLPMKIISGTARVTFKSKPKRFYISPFVLSWSVGDFDICGGTYDTPGGLFETQGRFGGTPAGADCLWHMKVEPGTTVDFTVDGQFGEGSLNNCTTDFLAFKRTPLDTPFYALCGDLPLTFNLQAPWDVYIHVKTEKETRDQLTIEWETSISPGAPTPCYGAVVSGPAGTIKAPDLISGLNCSWEITAPEGWGLWVEVSGNIATQSHISCDTDFLQIIDHSDVEVFQEKRCCNENCKQNFLAFGNQLTVRFESTSEVQGIEVSWSLERQPTCNGHYTSNYGQYLSPGSPWYYPPNANCTMVIEAEPGLTLELGYIGSMVDESENCEKDYFEIIDMGNDWPMVDKMQCDGSTALPRISYSNRVTVRFVSDDDKIGKDGFQFYWKPGPPTCGSNLSAYFGEVKSPGFKVKLPPSLNCEWTNQVDEPQVFVIQFTSMDVQESPNCNEDYVEIIDAEKAIDLGRFCGSALRKVVAFTSKFIIRLVTNSVKKDGYFSIRWQTADSSRCGGVYSGVSGYFTSPDYRPGFQQDTICAWEIQSPVNSTATVVIDYLNVTHVDDCGLEFVQVIDLADGHHFDRICGRESCKQYHSQSDRLLIIFVAPVGDGGEDDGVVVNWNNNSLIKFQSDKGFIQIRHFQVRLVVPVDTSVQLDCNVVPFQTTFNIVLTCPDEVPVVASGYKTSVTLRVTKAHHRKKCTCTAKNPDGLYDDLEELELLVVYGPESVEAVLAAGTTQIQSTCHAILVSCHWNETGESQRASSDVTGNVFDAVDMGTGRNPNGAATSGTLFRSNSTGRQVYTCLVENDYFPYINASDEVEVYVGESHWTMEGDENTAKVDGTVYLRYDQPSEVSCVLVGGIPQMMNSVVTCDGVAEQRAGERSNMTVTYTLADVTCKCSAQTSNDCFNETATFGLQVAWGPSAVESEIESVGTYSICHEVTISCAVAEGDFTPNVTVVLQGLPTGDLYPESTWVHNTWTFFNFTFTPHKTGILDFTCLANNTIFPSLHAGYMIELQVSDTTLTLTLDRGNPVGNGSTHNVLLGDSFHGKCFVSSPYPPVMELTITCGGQAMSTAENTIVTEFEVTSELHGTSCQCSVTTPTGCYQSTTHAVFNVGYGPTSVSIATPFEAEEYATFCFVTVLCEITKADVHPTGTIEFLDPLGTPVPPTDVVVMLDVIQVVFTFNHGTVEDVNVTCVASNTQFDVKASQKKFMTFSDPRIKMTLMDGTSPSSGGVVDVLDGQAFSLDCQLEGGLPSDVNMTAECGSGKIYNTTAGSRSSLRFVFSRDDALLICACSFVTESNCAIGDDFFTLNGAWGPTEVTGRVSAPNTDISICHVVEVTCEVNATLVDPKPSTVLRGLPGGDANANSTFDSDGFHRYTFNFGPMATGMTHVTCVSNNTVYGHVSATGGVDVLVDETLLTVTGNDGDAIENNTDYKVLPGTVFTPTCLLVGATPPLLTVNFTCVENALVLIPEVNVSFTVETDHHAVKCQCVVTTPSDCYQDVLYFSLLVAFGPLDVNFGQTDVVEYSICPGRDNTVSIWCEILMADVFPKPGVVLRGLQGGELNVSFSTETVATYLYNFKFIPTPGATTLVCVATNAIVQDEQTVKALDIFVNEPSSQFPSVRIKNGPSLSQGSSHNARLGFTDVECTVVGGTPPVTNVTLTCGEFTQTMDGVTATLTVEIRQSPKELHCECTAHHVSNCYDLSTQITIVSIYQPNVVTVGPLGIFDLCPGEVSQMSMFCSMDRDDGNFLPTFVLRRDAMDVDLDPYMNSTSGNDIMHHFQFRPTTGGNHPAKCVAINTVFTDLVRETGFTYTVHEPPHDAPKLFVNGALVTTSSLNISLGVSIEVLCIVEGGFPHVTDVTLECDGDDVTTLGTNSSMTLDIVRNSHLDVCSCRASHVAGCYPLTSQFNIEVWEPTIIVDYEFNARKRDVRLSAGSSNRFYCVAEGIPLPQLSIKGLYSQETLPAQMTTVNHYTRKIDFAKRMACNESDTYVCVADNGIATSTSMDARIGCPIERVIVERRERSDRTFVRPGNVVTFVFEIISRPPPTKVVMFKLRVVGQGRARREVAQVEVDGSQYMTSFAEKNVNMGELKLEFYDTNVDDVNDYRLDVENGLGSIDIDFQTILKEDDETEGGVTVESQTSSGQATVLTIVAIVTVVAITFFIVLLVFYNKWMGKDMRKELKKERERNIRRHNQERNEEPTFWRSSRRM